MIIEADIVVLQIRLFFFCQVNRFIHRSNSCRVPKNISFGAGVAKAFCRPRYAVFINLNRQPVNASRSFEFCCLTKVEYPDSLNPSFRSSFKKSKIYSSCFWKKYNFFNSVKNFKAPGEASNSIDRTSGFFQTLIFILFSVAKFLPFRI